MRALVTGATGFIGVNLVGRLLDEGWHVSLVTRPESSTQILNKFIDSIDIYIHSGSMKSMSEIMKKAKPDVVYHLAAMIAAEHSEDDVDKMIVANIQFSTQLVEAMFRNNVKNIINTETFWQYQNGDDKFVPVCLYAATKQAFRDILEYYVKSCQLNVISLILYDTYGVNDSRKKLLFHLKESIKNSGCLDMTPGEQLIDIVHVCDVVNAYLIASDILLRGENKIKTYSVTSGARITLREFVKEIEVITGLTFNINWGAKSYRKNEVMLPRLTEALPGWKPKVSRIMGISEVFRC